MIGLLKQYSLLWKKAKEREKRKFLLVVHDYSYCVFSEFENGHNLGRLGNGVSRKNKDLQPDMRGSGECKVMSISTLDLVFPKETISNTEVMIRWIRTCSTSMTIFGYAIYRSLLFVFLVIISTFTPLFDLFGIVSKHKKLWLSLFYCLCM